VTTPLLPTHTTPLTPDEVAARVADGRVNVDSLRESRSVASILAGNIFTRFNAIITAMVAVILVFGHPIDALFGLVMVLNASIGIIQELRAKRTLDRLTVLVVPRATVRRSSGDVDISAEAIVEDDILLLGRGQQVPVDGIVLESSGLEVSEALLTGEQDAIPKGPGDSVLSGSFVVAGNGTCVVTAVGDDAYAHELAREARKFALGKSDLARSIDTILRIVTWLLIPTSALLLWSQLDAGHGLRDAIVSTVAGVVAMVPQGLVLLVSMAMAVAVIRLGRKNVLVQELPAVETLARVDLLCVDKTGTLTDGTITLDDVVTIPGADEVDVAAVLATIAAADPDPNPTMLAIAHAYPTQARPAVSARVPFSSDRKTSAVAFDDGSAWVLGAPEILLSHDTPQETRDLVSSYEERGRRTVLVARTAPDLVAIGDATSGTPALVVVFAESIRDDAAETVEYFRRQNVDLRVISGDSPKTVAAVASDVGMPNTVARDTRELDEDSEGLADEIADIGVFGRVTPHQKRRLVAAFQGAGHVVGMTGDGVNDVLAIKDADLGIAMGSGASATRAVGQLVLLDDRFASLPYVVAEGRRVVANMERVSSLFLTKTVYATVLALLIGFVGLAFPFLPRHMTLIGSLTIGIPAFLLSFEPRDTPIRPGFLARVLAFALPSGIATGLATFLIYGITRIDAVNASLVESRTAATTVMVALGLVVLYELIEPPERHHIAMVMSLAAAYLGVLVVPGTRTFFDLVPIRWEAWVVILVVSGLVGIALKFLIARSRSFVARRYSISPV